jgi:hypothetical protein
MASALQECQPKGDPRLPLCGSCLPVRPDPPRRQTAAGILHRLPAVDQNRTRDGCNQLLQRGLKRCAVIRVDLGSRDLIDKAACGRLHSDLGQRSPCRGRMIAIVPDPGRQKDKRENQSDHHIVVETASLVCPEEIALQSSSDIHATLPLPSLAARSPSGHPYRVSAPRVCEPSHSPADSSP